MVATLTLNNFFKENLRIILGKFLRKFTWLLRENYRRILSELRVIKFKIKCRKNFGALGSSVFLKGKDKDPFNPSKVKQRMALNFSVCLFVCLFVSYSKLFAIILQLPKNSSGIPHYFFSFLKFYFTF